MAVKGPGFSERVFEFSFNAEYAARNRAVLAAAPSIPTQNEEKWLGYDVAFEVQKRGGAIHLLALQHKVARFVDTKTASNDHFWTEVAGEYFAFRLDSAQYNLIESVAVASLPGIEFYYCAPLFATREEMSSLFLTSSVESHSLWIDVATSGSIDEEEPHTIVYSKDGSEAALFSSEAKGLRTKRHVVRAQEQEQRRAAEPRITEEEINSIYTTLFDEVSARWQGGGWQGAIEATVESSIRPKEAPRKSEASVPNIGRLLAEYFGVSLLVEVRN